MFVLRHTQSFVNQLIGAINFNSQFQISLFGLKASTPHPLLRLHHLKLEMFKKITEREREGGEEGGREGGVVGVASMVFV